MGIEKSGFTKLEDDYKDLEIFIQGPVGLISLKKFKDDIKAHRQSGNHLDYRLIMELKNALKSFEKNSSISSIILTSSHKVAFSRGAKIEEVLDTETEKCRDFLKKAQDLLLFIHFVNPLLLQ